MKVKVKSKNNKRNSCFSLIERMIIYKKADLSMINQNIRINNSSLYLTALRVARDENSSDDYINALNILHLDISYCKSKDKKEYLKRIFNDYIELNPFQRETQFKNYKKTILQSL